MVSLQESVQLGNMLYFACDACLQKNNVSNYNQVVYLYNDSRLLFLDVNG